MTVQHNTSGGFGFAFDAWAKNTKGWEWIIAGFLTVLWSSALLTYGAGYFGWFEAGTARNATLLEVMLYLCALILPILICWIGAFFVAQILQVRSEARQLRRAVGELKSAMSIHGPAGREEVISAISEKAEATIRGEQKRLTSEIKTLRISNQELSDMVKKALQQTGAEQKIVHKLVETAQDVAEKAQRKVEAADTKVRNGQASTPASVSQDAENQDALPFDDDATSKRKARKHLDWADLNRALNFPQDESDKDGFAAIKRVLPHRNTAQLLQAAEDVLSMLAQEGIYMDDLIVAPANPDLWREFAAGARGEEIADMGTVDDQAALALVRGRMRNDQVFKDGVLHFLRLFDRVVNEFSTEATDRDLVTLAGTRSGLAFLLLARANGTFS